MEGLSEKAKYEHLGSKFETQSGEHKTEKRLMSVQVILLWQKTN